MNEYTYLAKSIPNVETIQIHTDNLLENFNQLKKLYPNIEVNWKVLYHACLYHDLGKMNLKFQKRIQTGIFSEEEVPHGYLSIGLIDEDALTSDGWLSEELKLLYHAVARHHDRKIPEEETVKEEVNALENTFKHFSYKKIEGISSIQYPSKRYFKIDTFIGEKKDNNLFYESVMVKGLLNRLDYAASAHILVEQENDFLEESLEEMLSSWREKIPDAKWNELQEYMIEHREDNVVVVAQTGMGKTEAGLLWLGNKKGFFTLPLKNAINAIYYRIINEIVLTEKKTLIGLLHSDTFSKYLELEEMEKFKNPLKSGHEEITIEEYYATTRQLSLPVTVCTLDQLFDFVFKYRGFEHKLATLSYSKIILDEIQMYAPELVAYIVIGLKYITHLNGKFAILTATLPEFIKDLLVRENIEFQCPKPFITSRIRHSIKMVHNEINPEFIAPYFSENKILVICNTVKKAREMYVGLKNLLDEKDRNKIHLLHSQFIKCHRNDKEKHILKTGKKEIRQSEIWVTTQIVEASLDIDFDLLFTELSDLNGLFQRFGRCYRNRELDTDYNCYVFDGGYGKGGLKSGRCSGVGRPVDPDVFEQSKRALEKVDGPLSEALKLELISLNYTTDALLHTEYYKKIEQKIQDMSNLNAFEFTSPQVKQLFRNINNETCMPRCIFERYQSQIEANLEQLNYSGIKGKESRKQMEIRKERAKAKDFIMSLTVDLGQFIVNDLKKEIFPISKYENIYIIDCEYDEINGVGVCKTKNQSISDFADRTF